MPMKSLPLFFVSFLGLAAIATQAASQEQAGTQSPEPGQAEAIDAQREEVARARRTFSGFRLDLEEKQEVYRALRALGYASEDLDVPAFLLRKSTILAVTEFQRTIGAVATGFLTKDQIEALRGAATRSNPEAQDPVQKARLAFETQNLSCQDQRVVYRALFARGHTTRRTAFPDFLSDEYVIAGVTEFQKGIGEEATGYLTRKQVKSLQADAGKSYLWEHRTCDPDMMLFPLNKWIAAGFAESDKQVVFDKLHSDGFVTGNKLFSSYSDQDNKIAAGLFQASIGAEQTGYLTSKQADGILHGWLLPSPKERWIALAVPGEQKKQLYRALLDLGHLKDVIPIVDFTFNKDLIRAVRRYQDASSFPTTGYLTRSQVDLLLAHEIKPVPADKEQAKKRWSNPVMSRRYADYSERELTILYQALYNKGFFLEETVNTDLTHPELVKRIRKYQESIVANPTGYLSHLQIVGLLADHGNSLSPEQIKKRSTGLLGKKTLQVQPSARSDWEKLAFSLVEKQKIYRALYHLGLAKTPEMITDFSYRMNLIEVVRAYQEQNGFEATGFLTSEQAGKLLSIKAPLLPSEQQEAFLSVFGRAAVLGFFRDLGKQEFGISNPITTIAMRLQNRFELTAHGYITPELFEKAKTVPLQVIRDTRRPQTLYFDAEELPLVKDWGLWRSKDASACETSTYSIHEDGFTGSAVPAGVALKRNTDGKDTPFKITVRLRNWKPASIASLRVGGRSYLFKEAFGRTMLVGPDGYRLRNHQRNYAELIKSAVLASGFEIAYETEFGSKAFVSFSALGLAKQIRALSDTC
ncbi:hypothetical protein [Roseibium sp.]|uniref:hypothetical protein n=1 Tax=Roseibium sp. TaxID=1936156 RepID=UPI003B50230B